MNPFLVFATLMTADFSWDACSCESARSMDSTLNQSEVAIHGKLLRVRGMDTSETFGGNPGSYLLTFGVDSVLHGRAGKTLSIEWRGGDLQPCHFSKQGFKIRTRYVIGIDRLYKARPSQVEKRKNPLFPNDYKPGNRKMYPWFTKCSWISEILETDSIKTSK